MNLISTAAHMSVSTPFLVDRVLVIVLNVKILEKCKNSAPPKGSIAQNKRPGAHEHDFTLFLMLARLIKIGNLGLLKVYDFFNWECFVVEL